MTTTSAVQPVKGMVWEHARRKQWNGEPMTLTVTSVNVKTALVYSTTVINTKVKTPLALFALDKMVKAVVSTPEVKAAAVSVKMTESQCRVLYSKASEAGLAAGEAALPTPMVVVQRENPWDDTSPIAKRYAPIMDGACGFAYVVVRPGNSAFARWLKANKRAYAGYYGGTEMGVSPFGQSLERKTAYARAFALVLTEAGLNASYNSRMD